LEEGQRCYAFDNSGLVKEDSIFDPHRPYQKPSALLVAFFYALPHYSSVPHQSLRRLKLAKNSGVSLVIGKNKEHWRELCERASVEQDPVKLLELVKEINRLLDDKQARLSRQDAKNNE
jgi:hypothetical protein